MAVVGLQTWIWRNELKTWLLIFLFPVAIFGTIYVVLLILMFQETASEIDPVQLTNELFLGIVAVGWPLVLIWLLVSIFFHKSILFKITHTKPITRKDSPDLYNIVENLCISRGLPVPKIGIIHSKGMNAFATGWSKKNSWVVFTTGLLDNLNKKEVEAVAAHELTHIINRDVRLMVIVSVFIGIISTLGYALFRISASGRGNKKWKGAAIFMIIGLALYLLSLIALPLIQFAISRKREFLADSGSVELTKDPKSMVSALKKISRHAHVETITDKNIQAMCTMWLSPKKKTSFFSTHPSVEDRITALEWQYHIL